MEPTLAELKKQEASLVARTFTAADALAVGLIAVELARTEWKKPVAIHIETDSWPLFTHYMEGTGADNVYWVNVKKAVVQKFGTSSLAVRRDHLDRGVDFAQATGLAPEQYRAEGGSIPLNVEGRGRIGTLTVSGMEGVDDHALAVEALRRHLNQ
jgi:uncharacterized protein (UPF0303 family)